MKKRDARTASLLYLLMNSFLPNLSYVIVNEKHSKLNPVDGFVCWDLMVPK